MTVTTITEPTGDDLTKLVFAKRLRANSSMDLLNDTKYAVVILKLAAAVTPADYGTLATAVKTIAGINDIDLLMDHQTKAVVPENHTQVLSVAADIKLRDDTPEPE